MSSLPRICSVRFRFLQIIHIHPFTHALGCTREYATVAKAQHVGLVETAGAVHAANEGVDVAQGFGFGVNFGAHDGHAEGMAAMGAYAVFVMGDVSTVCNLASRASGI